MASTPAASSPDLFRTYVIFPLGATAAAGALAATALHRIPTLWAIVRDGQAPPQGSHADANLVAIYVAWITLAVLALILLSLSEGRRNMGLGQSARESGIALGAYLAVIIPVLVVTDLLLTGAWKSFPDLHAWVGNSVVYERTPWFVVFDAVTNGVVTNIVAVAVAVRFLEYVPTAPWKPDFTDTGWATALIVALHVLLYLNSGLLVVLWALWAWLKVRLYRRTRTLGALIAGDVVYSVTSAVARLWVPTLSLAGLLMVTVPLAGLLVIYLCHRRKNPLSIAWWALGGSRRPANMMTLR